MGVMNIEDVAMRVPEYILFYGVQAGLDYLAADYAANISTPEKCLLYLYTRNVGFQRYNFFEQAKKIFIPAKDDPRKLTLDLMFNQQKEGVPNIYISMPGEQPSSQNAVGFGGNEDDVIFEDFNNVGEDGTFRPGFSRRFTTTYNLVITSDNSNEVVLIYHVVKALLISMNAHFALAGFENLKMGGGDLKNYNKEIPNNLHIRALTLTFDYETSAVDFSKYPMINNLIFNGTPYTDDTTTTTTTTAAPTTTTTTTT